MAAITQGNTKSLKAYVIGFTLSLALTVAAFALIKLHALSDTMLYVTLAALAVMQLIVQSSCFLGLNIKQEGRWNLLPFLFTIFVIAILVTGSLWIMYNMNYNMLISINSDSVNELVKR